MEIEIQNLKFGTWNSEIEIWNFKLRNWNSEFKIWDLKFAIWNSEFENLEFENLEFEHLEFENSEFENSEFENLEFDNLVWKYSSIFLFLIHSYLGPFLALQSYPFGPSGLFFGLGVRLKTSTLSTLFFCFWFSHIFYIICLKSLFFALPGNFWSFGAIFWGVGVRFNNIFGPNSVDY